jgi:hypothetical protein
VGGYLNRVFGTLPWLFIYFASGIFGNMLRSLSLPLSPLSGALI